MYYTYILRSKSQKGAIYIGSTKDLVKRLLGHNLGPGALHTKKHAPWCLESYFCFTFRSQAEEFELYLKSSSGRAFLRKRLISKSFLNDLNSFSNNRKVQ